LKLLYFIIKLSPLPLTIIVVVITNIKSLIIYKILPPFNFQLHELSLTCLVPCCACVDSSNTSTLTCLLLVGEEFSVLRYHVDSSGQCILLLSSIEFALFGSLMAWSFNNFICFNASVIYFVLIVILLYFD